MTNTLAYFVTAKIAVVKSFIGHALGLQLNGHNSDLSHSGNRKQTLSVPWISTEVQVLRLQRHWNSGLRVIQRFFFVTDDMTRCREY
jgi:hypothetical protein